MSERIFVTAVVDVIDSDIVKIIKGKTYPVHNVFDRGDHWVGSIYTETEFEALIVFDSVIYPCAWQNGKSWLVERVAVQ